MSRAVGTLRGWLGHICVYLRQGDDLDQHALWSNCQIVYIRSSSPRPLCLALLPSPYFDHRLPLQSITWTLTGASTATAVLCALSYTAIMNHMLTHNRMALMLIVQTSVKNGLVPLPLSTPLILLDLPLYGLSSTMRKFPILEFLGLAMVAQAYVHGHP